MMKHIYLLLFCNYIITAQPQSAQKFVIGARNCGFFSAFIGTLNNLAYCYENNLTPVVYWDKTSPYWQKNGYNKATNAWEYYFEPVSNLSYTQGDKIYRGYLAPNGIGIKSVARGCGHAILQKQKNWAHSIIDKYIHIKPTIFQKIDDFYQQHMHGKKIIGIHLRGTDKKLEIKPVQPERIFAEANKYHGYHYFIATDDQRLLELAKKYLKGPIISYNSKRSQNGLALHKANKHAKLGEEVLIEAILLSQCDKFIHTCSNVSCAVLYFNPDLEHTLLKP